MRSISVTGSAKPARCNSAPRSRRSANGATRGEAPPSISLSAAAKDCRSSVSVSPPISAARNNPSGLSARRICTSTPGRSLTNCNASAETTRSNAASRNGSASSSADNSGRRRACLRRRHRIGAPRSSPTEPRRASAARTASPGVPRSSARSNRRSTAASRSARSSATRSSKNVAGPNQPPRAGGGCGAAGDRRSAGLQMSGLRPWSDCLTSRQGQACPTQAQKPR